MSVLFRYFGDALSTPRLSPKFEWDDWNYTEYYYFRDDQTVSRFDGLSGYACRSYCLAIAELMVARFDTFSDLSEIVNYLEAAWTTMEGTDSCDYGELFSDEWCGPTRRPVRAAALIANDTLFEALVDREFSLRCGWALQLCRYILDECDLIFFETWNSDAISKLRLLSDANSLDDMGFAVSPEFLVPNSNSTPGSIQKELKNHRMRIDPKNDWFGDFHYLH